MQHQTANRLTFEGNGKTKDVFLKKPLTVFQIRELLARLGKSPRMVTMADGSGVALVTF
jgi:hypothetical protein